jgi:hypothetical protein
MVAAWRDPAAWVEGIVRRYAVIAIDPLSAVASALDLDFDKSNAEFVRFYDRLIQPLVDAGATVALLENIGHATDARKRAKGVSAKRDRADITLSCSVRAAPAGLVVTARKVRTVRAAFQPGDRWIFDRETQRIIRDSNAAGDPWRPTHLMEKISRLLADGARGRNQIRSGVGAKTSHVDAALSALEHDGYITVEHAGQRKVHHLVKPYRVPGPPRPNRNPIPRQQPGPAGTHTP